MSRTKVEKQALDLINQFAKKLETPNWIIHTDEVITYKRLNGVPAGTIDHSIGSYIWELDIIAVPSN